MAYKLNSVSYYNSQVKFVNKLKNDPENSFGLYDTRLVSDSRNVYKKIEG